MGDGIVVMGAEVPSGRAIANKLRMERYSCTLMPSSATMEEIVRQSPAGIIIAGEAEEGAVPPDPSVLTLGLPVLSLGSSTRALLAQIGIRGAEEEILGSVTPMVYRESPLFPEMSVGERWIAYAQPYAMPEPYHAIAEGERFPLVFADEAARIYLLQFQIERNDPDGMDMLLAFVDTICGCTPWWTVENIVQNAEEAIRAVAGDGEAICAMSGGMDSTVAAVLTTRALGEGVRCVFVDTGLLRRGEADQAEEYFRETLHLNFSRVNAGDRVLAALKGITAAADKRRVIDREITRALLEASGDAPGNRVFIKGTNYVDTLEKEESPRDMERLPVVMEPLRDLLKNEIRGVGEFLSISPSVLGQQPFPGEGLAARVQGEVSEKRLEILRTADAVFSDALEESGQEKRLSRYFALLSQVDGHDTIVLRATQGMETTMSVARLPHDLLERVTEELCQSLPITRVLYDITPGPAEWV